VSRSRLAVGSQDEAYGRVLIADHETSITDLVATALRFVGFDTRVARTGAEALVLLPKFRPHLVVLDVALPDLDGFEVCRRIRRQYEHVSVVFLTDRTIRDDAVAALSAGGDDCISEPFSLDELVARIQAVLRRNAAAQIALETPVNAESVLRLADLELDRDRREVRRANTIIDLSPTEFALLRFLLENSGQVVTRPQILAHVWSYEFHGDARIVESYISFLRKKIDRFQPPLIQTLRGVGYSLRLGPEAISEGTK